METPAERLTPETPAERVLWETPATRRYFENCESGSVSSIPTNGGTMRREGNTSTFPPKSRTLLSILQLLCLSFNIACPPAPVKHYLGFQTIKAHPTALIENELRKSALRPQTLETFRTMHYLRFPVFTAIYGQDMKLGTIIKKSDTGIKPQTLARTLINTLLLIGSIELNPGPLENFFKWTLLQCIGNTCWYF